MNVIALPDQLTVTGELGTYVETGENDDGEYVHRRFCPSCGSPIVSEMLQAGIVAVKAGTLDDTSHIRPAVEVWCTDRQPWVELAGIPMSIERGLSTIGSEPAPALRARSTSGATTPPVGRRAPRRRPAELLQRFAPG